MERAASSNVTSSAKSAMSSSKTAFSMSRRSLTIADWVAASVVKGLAEVWPLEVVVALVLGLASEVGIGLGDLGVMPSGFVGDLGVMPGPGSGLGNVLG